MTSKHLLILAACCILFIAICCTVSYPVTKRSVEGAHGVELPHSAKNLQQQSWGLLMDRAKASIFEIDQADVQQFISQLRVRSRMGPAKTGPGNPCLNGSNVWPLNAPTYVPGNFDAFKRTWTGEAIPIEMLSCDSPKGDWLHVEIWSVGNHGLIKLCTDWN